jgi:prevent-host-death family protein
VITISYTDLSQRLGATLDAAQRAPVVIRKQNRHVAVLISMAEFEKLKGLHVSDFERLTHDISAEAARRGLDDERLAEILDDIS